MVQDKPYVHWKIKDNVDLTEIDPTYLWGTIIETDKGPIDEPVFITTAKQGKKIFNYDFAPFFANGGRYLVVVRAYSGTPKYSQFEITLDKEFSYAYVDYDYYSKTKAEKATVTLDSATIDNERPKVVKEGTPYDVTFHSGRWCLCNADGVVQYFYYEKDNPGVIQEAVVMYNERAKRYSVYEKGATENNIGENVPEADRKKLLKDIDFYLNF